MSRVYLIGYMGCGKSTLGKKLAKKLSYNFVDLDKLIEKEKEKSILEIFENEGEEAFRLMEKNTLLSTFEYEDTVISLGGGTPCFYDNMDNINVNGVSVYLKMPPKLLLDRLTNAKKARPLMLNKSKEEMLELIKEQLSFREKFYLKAKYVVNAINLKPEQLLSII